MIGAIRRFLFGQSTRETEINRLRAELSHEVARARTIKASYESAISNDETLGLWAKADNLSARAANSLGVRRELRQRSRHEYGNSAHFKGIASTIANDLVGTGPALQVLTDSEPVNDVVESRWNEWCSEVCFASKLHTAALAKTVDGEAVGKIVRNDSLMNSVRLDIQVIDCDYMSTPADKFNAQTVLVDGMDLDSLGNPVAYHFLRYHPGDVGVAVEPSMAYDREPAKNVLHWFRMDRPQQCRGIPELTPALLIFGHLREYSAAVLQAARVAACLSALIHTKASPDTSAASLGGFDAMDLEAGMVMALPEGYDVTQMRPEQPTQTYDAYVLRKLAEACHAVNLPYSIGTGDFSKESYAGGRMARQVYQSSVAVQRQRLNETVLNKVFYAWLEEAINIPGYLPSSLKTISFVPHEWHYDPWEHIDETKAATAITSNLGNFTTTLAVECAKRKMDWRRVIQQRAREIEMQKELGVLILPPGTLPPDQNDGGANADANAAAA
jgi:lambda family phage portal protein